MIKMLGLICVGLAASLASRHAHADDGKTSEKPTRPPAAAQRKSASVPAPQVTPESETEALGFVQEHHPELAKVLEVLKPMNPAEYRKAIIELLQVSRSLSDLKIRNPLRYEVALDAWKTKSRVELIAAQLAGSPGEELRSQLRTAIEAKVDAEIRRQRFELEQSEAAAKKARETIERLEKNRQTIVDARFRALVPKKIVKPKKSAESQPSAAPSTKPASPEPVKPAREDRR